MHYETSMKAIVTEIRRIMDMVSWYVMNACYGLNCFKLVWDEMSVILKLENELDWASTSKCITF